MPQFLDHLRVDIHHFAQLSIPNFIRLALSHRDLESPRDVEPEHSLRVHIFSHLLQSLYALAPETGDRILPRRCVVQIHEGLVDAELSRFILNAGEKLTRRPLDFGIICLVRPACGEERHYERARGSGEAEGIEVGGGSGVDGRR